MPTPRALPTLVRYRAAAHAEFLRSLHALRALRAERAKPARARADEPVAARTGTASKARPAKSAPSPVAAARPIEPERSAGTRRQDVLPEQAAPALALHEAAAPWLPRPDAPPRPNEPEAPRVRAAARAGTERPPAPGAS